MGTTTDNRNVAQNARLEDMFRQHHSRVINAAYRVTGSLDDAEDVAQTVFLRLARQPESLDAVTDAGSYLHRAAVNAALDVIRSRHKANPVPLADVEELLASPSISADRHYASSQVQESLRRALSKLSPQAAEIVVLRYIEDYSNAEIATIIGTSRMTIGVTLYRARHVLKKHFQQSLRKKP